MGERTPPPPPRFVVYGTGQTIVVDGGKLLHLRYDPALPTRINSLSQFVMLPGLRSRAPPAKVWGSIPRCPSHGHPFSKPSAQLGSGWLLTPPGLIAEIA